jgi:c-di-GMP-binding flagellar brake protein YcgR
MQPASDAFKIGARLQLGFGDDLLVWVPTRVEDYDPEGRIVVAWPTDAERRLIKLMTSVRVQVMVAAAKDALYAATAIVEHTTQADIPLVTLSLDGPWQRMQRRAAVRESVAVRPRIAQVLHGPARRELRLGVTNVSATGVQVRSRDELRPGDLLELAFELDGEVQLKAHVRRVCRTERSWEAGCEFDGVSDSLARRIVQFIFAQQRAMLRARRGGA